jgi:hypothetical protein
MLHITLKLAMCAGAAILTAHLAELMRAIADTE